MSLIGKKPVIVPAGVKVELTAGKIKISSGANALQLDIHPQIEVKYDSAAGQIAVSRKDDERLVRAMHGTTRAHIANMVLGVTKGFVRSMKIFGTGYGIKEVNKQLHITVGYAKPAVIPIPDGVKVEIKIPNAKGNDIPAEFIISSPDKHKVGQLAATVRRVRPPEPYQGKGIRYTDETIKRKVGKAFGSG